MGRAWGRQEKTGETRDERPHRHHRTLFISRALSFSGKMLLLQHRSSRFRNRTRLLIAPCFTLEPKQLFNYGRKLLQAGDALKRAEMGRSSILPK